VGAALATAGSAMLLAFSGDRASALESKLQEKAEESQALEMAMEGVKAAIDSYKNEENKLVSSNIANLASGSDILTFFGQIEMSKIIVIICRLLTGLCGDILVLLTAFSELNSKIKDLVREHKDAKRVARGIERDIRASDDMPQVNRRDYDTFRNQLHEMRRLSASIQSVAVLYAGIIKDAISPGFTKVVQIAYEDGGGSNAAVALYNKQRYMMDYLDNAERLCRMREDDAKVALKRILTEMDAVHSTRMKRGLTKGKQKVIQPRNGSSRSIFSKIFRT
jgi:hypothetical protein